MHGVMGRGSTIPKIKNLQKKIDNLPQGFVKQWEMDKFTMRNGLSYHGGQNKIFMINCVVRKLCQY